MKVKLSSDCTLNVNGIALGLHKGTEVILATEDRDAAAEFVSIAKIPVDLSHDEGGKKVYYGAAGKKFYAPAEVPKADPKPKAPAKEPKKKQ